MWQIKLLTPMGVYDRFCEFLASTKGSELISAHGQHVANNGEPCLLDIVSIWIGFEDEILRVPSYDVFMAGLVMIIDDWIEEDRTFVRESPVWLDAKTGEPRIVKSLLPKEADGGNLFDHVFAVGLQHELLTRVAFEATREVAQQRQQRNIQEMLARLMPSEPTR